MNKTSIVILSYNTYNLTKFCIESIRKYTPAGSYEIIVIDNASQDESVEWLKEQTDIRLVCNEKNRGFPAGCNQGMAMAEQGNDILLLNSDTIVTPRWLENLQIALYSEPKVGAVSCITSNCSNWQQIDVKYETYEELMDFADKMNHSNPELWEVRPKLVGFCYLIKNEAYKIAGFLDEIYSPGNYEDNDYSLKLIMAGYKLLVCRDTFIHHYGSGSFGKHATLEEFEEKNRKYKALLQRNQEIFLKKWQITENYDERHTVIFDVDVPRDTTMRIFVIDCNMGMSISYLKYKYFNAQISGATENWAEAALAGKYLDVSYCPNMEKNVFVLLTGKYDYILLADKDRQYDDFDGYIAKLVEYLTPEGSIHISE